MNAFQAFEFIIVGGATLIVFILVVGSMYRWYLHKQLEKLDEKRFERELKDGLAASDKRESAVGGRWKKVEDVPAPADD